MNRKTCIAVLLFLWVAPPVGLAQQYSIVDLGTLGGSTSSAEAISVNGFVAGDARIASGAKHAALWGESGIMDLGAPAGFNVSTAVGVNASGQVAGNGEGSPQSYRAYRYESGLWTPLGLLPGRSESEAADIDSAGRVVGSSFTLGAGDSRAFLWDAGVLAPLGTLGGATYAKAINEVGAVVGYSQADLPEGGQASRAYIWQDSMMTNLGVLPGEASSWAFDVNDQGEVVGSSWHATIPNFFSAHRATLWRDWGAEIVDLGRTPGPPVCVSGYPYYTVNIARGINNWGQVVGEAHCTASGGPLAAFLWQDGVNSNLNDLIPEGTGWDLLSAEAINDDGEIVGVGVGPSGTLHAFLLVPVPVSVGEISPSRSSLRVFPNPFRNVTQGSFLLPARSPVRLTVYDAQGRRVARLLDAVQAEGPHFFTWSARDDSGIPIPSGIYFLRLEETQRTEQQKLIVLR